MNNPIPVALDRVKIIFDELKDGLIALRENVNDISLGENTRYAPIRILLEGDAFIKGMGVYSDDIPDGYDIVAYVNPERPFYTVRGTFPENIFDVGTKIKEQHGIINVVDIGDGWTEWKAQLPWRT